MTNNIKNNKITFSSGGYLTLGVEVELQIIDQNNCNLTPRSEELLKKTVDNKKIKQEFYLSTIEANTDKCHNISEISKDLSTSFDFLEDISKNMGIEFSTTGCHPFSRYSDCIITPSKRYNQLIDRNQWLTKRMTVYGIHIHIGMKNGDDCIKFNNFFLHFIPHLLALSASSPFWQGDDTGLASCRPTTYESLPTAGQPYDIKSWNDFEKLCAVLKKCKAIESISDLWWDIRPSPKFGTLEIRACDGGATLQETLAIAAYIHLLAHWFSDNIGWIDRAVAPEHWLARENKWRAIRHGLNANFISNIEGSTKPINQDILEWIKELSPYIKKLGYEQYSEDLKQIVKNGNSSSRQLEIYKKTNCLKEVVKFNVDEFKNRRPINVNDWLDKIGKIH